MKQGHVVIKGLGSVATVAAQPHHAFVGDAAQDRRIVETSFHALMGRVAVGVAVDAAGMEEDAARLQEERARSLGAILRGRRLLRPRRRAGDQEKQEAPAHAGNLDQRKTNLNCPRDSESDFLVRLGVGLADGLRVAWVAAQVVEVVVGAIEPSLRGEPRVAALPRQDLR